jgi:hypothetical protein
MLEENVVSAAGCFHLASIERIEKQIERAGFAPRQRNSWYGIVDPRHEGKCFPANREEAATHRGAPRTGARAGGLAPESGERAPTAAEMDAVAKETASGSGTGVPTA